MDDLEVPTFEETVHVWSHIAIMVDKGMSMLPCWHAEQDQGMATQHLLGMSFTMSDVTIPKGSTIEPSWQTQTFSQWAIP